MEMPRKSTPDDPSYLDPLQSQDYPQATNVTHMPTTSLSSLAQLPTQTFTNPRDFNPNSPPVSETIDKFATLFSPSTPRASPTFPSIALPDEGGIFDQTTHIKSHTNAYPGQHRRNQSTSSDDFGVFVSVSSFEDPLSPGDISAFEEHGFAAPVAATSAAHPIVGSSESQKEKRTTNPRFSFPPPPRPSSRTSSSSSSSMHTRASSQINTSLSFFDQFTQESRERSSATRSLVLDELLLHQDDPLYFLKNPKPKENAGEYQSGLPPLLSPPLIALPASIDPPPLVPSPLPFVENSPQPASGPHSLLDLNLNEELDHDYFRIRPTATQKHAVHPVLRSPPSRSSLIHVPTLAPPIASPEGAMRSKGQRSPSPAAPHLIDISHNITASSPPSDDVWRDAKEDTDIHQDGRRIARSASHQSLSGSLTTLPGKWMSTLLRAAPPPPPPSPHGHAPSHSHIQGAKPALESIFSSGSDGPSPSTPSWDSTTLKPSSPQRRRSDAHQQPKQQPTFTHTSAFAPSPAMPSNSMALTHGASPFSPHTYIPPSGAPGFKGEGYAWDRGYSEELEAERVRESGKELHGHGSGSGKDRDPRTGHVKAMTVPGFGKENERGMGGDGFATTGHSSRGSGSGWGSGFGFSFGSVRPGGGKHKVAADSGSGSGLMSASSSSLASNGSGRDSSFYSAESGSDRSLYAHEGGASSAGDSKVLKNFADVDSAAIAEEFIGDGARHGSKAVTRLNDTQGQDKDSMGAFIERKSANVELVGRRAATTPVLAPEQAGMLRSHLPALSRLPRSWTLIYSLDQDGISLNTLYTRCEAHVTRRPAPGEIIMGNSGMMVVVQDAEGAVFGVWLAEGIRPNKGGRGYFGGGESFLWKYIDGTLKVFKCTGKNNYIALCEPEYISFGGGSGHYGLYLDDTLFDGSSAPCPTFDNEPLCSPGPRKGASVNFECVGLEVWGMGP